MRGWRFYEELNFKNRLGETSKGTVIAVAHENRRIERNGDGTYHTVYDAIGGVYEEPNSPVGSTGAAAEYLSDDCRRIPEERAREIHPALFQFLDQE